MKAVIEVTIETQADDADLERAVTDLIDVIRYRTNSYLEHEWHLGVAVTSIAWHDVSDRIDLDHAILAPRIGE